MNTEKNIIKHGNHRIDNDKDGYMYSFNTSQGYTFNSHIHKCYEFIYIIKGKLLYTVEDTSYILSEGDMIITNPDELHSFSFPNECEYQRAFLHIYPDFLKDYPEMLEILNSRRSGYFNRFPSETVKKYGIDKIFENIGECCREVTPETDFLVLTYSLQFIIKIKQILRNESPEHQEVIANKTANAVCDYIDNHFNENITTDDIANMLFMSVSYVSRIFKKETGMTIKAYLNMRRITNAKNLIMQGENASSIFEDCGFSDYSTFYRAFEKYVGMTPSKFKQTHNDKDFENE